MYLLKVNNDLTSEALSVAYSWVQLTIHPTVTLSLFPVSADTSRIQTILPPPPPPLSLAYPIELNTEFRNFSNGCSLTSNYEINCCSNLYWSARTWQATTRQYITSCIRHYYHDQNKGTNYKSQEMAKPNLITMSKNAKFPLFRSRRHVTEWEWDQ